MTQYKGYTIFKHDANSMGLKYYAYSCFGGKLRADTLNGIRYRINDELRLRMV